MAGVAVEACWTDLDALPGPDESLLDLLDDAERARAGRLRFERDRRRFILRRGVLRVLLARQSGVAPARLRFTRGACGKPALHGSDLRFSASHSHGVALYAFAWGVELGCDIERRDGRIAATDTARVWFAPGEIAELRRLPPGRREAGFFRCWTRKEAYVKALGLGLSHGLDGFDTSSRDGDMAGWAIESFEPCPSYHAAIAARVERMEITRVEVTARRGAIASAAGRCIG